MEKTLKQQYQQLSTGKQRQIKAKYATSIGSLKSFYRKINGDTKLRLFEIEFFNQNLLSNGSGNV